MNSKLRLLILSCLVVFSLFISNDVAAQSKMTGKLYFDVNLPEPFYVVLNDDLINAQKISPGDTLSLPSGLYDITLISYFIDDEYFEQYVDANSITRIHRNYQKFRILHRSTFTQLENRANLAIKTDPGAEIFIDGEKVGIENSSLLLNPGKYTVKSVHPELGTITNKVKISYAETELLNRYHTNQSTRSPGLYFLPAGGYIITEQTNKVIFTYLTLSALGVSYFTIDNKLRESDYIYDHDRLRTLQKASLYTFGAVYLLTTIDGLRKPKGGYPGKEKSIFIDQAMIHGKSVPMAGLNISF